MFVCFCWLLMLFLIFPQQITNNWIIAGEKNALLHPLLLLGGMFWGLCVVRPCSDSCACGHTGFTNSLTHHLHNEKLQSRPRHNSAHVTTTPLVTTPPPLEPIMRRYNPVRITATPLVTTPPCHNPKWDVIILSSSQPHPSWQLRPVTTQNETLQFRPRHSHTPCDDSALVITHHHLQNETLQSRPRQNHASRDNPALVTTHPPLA